MVTTTLARGVDVSRHQKHIDWPLIPDHIVFAQIGVTHWPTGEIDWEAEANVNGALRRGVIPGGYQRINPIRNTPEREVAMFLGRLSHLNLWEPGRLLPAWDIEPVATGVDANGQPIDKEHAAGIDMKVWVRELFTAWVGLSPDPRVLWYTSGSFYTDRYGGYGGIPSTVKLWPAHWSGRYSDPKNPAGDPQLAEQWAGKTSYRGDPEHKALIHQYWNSGELPGIGPDSSTGKPIKVDLCCLMPGVQLGDVM